MLFGTGARLFTLHCSRPSPPLCVSASAAAANQGAAVAGLLCPASFAGPHVLNESPKMAVNS